MSSKRNVGNCRFLSVFVRKCRLMSGKTSKWVGLVSDGKYTTSVQRLSSLSGIIFRNLHHCFGGKNTILKTRSQVFEWLFLEIFIQPKTWRRIFKCCWCFQISSSSFPTFSPSQNKNSPSRFYFLRRQIFSTSENSCHSLHEYCNPLIISSSWCNDKENSISLMSLLNRVTSVTWEKQAHYTEKRWYSTIYETRAMSDMSLRK